MKIYKGCGVVYVPEKIFPIAISSGNPYNKNVQSQGKKREKRKRPKSFPCVEPFSRPDWYRIITDKEEESDDYA